MFFYFLSMAAFPAGFGTWTDLLEPSSPLPHVVPYYGDPAPPATGDIVLRFWRSLGSSGGGRLLLQLPRAEARSRPPPLMTEWAGHGRPREKRKQWIIDRLDLVPSARKLVEEAFRCPRRNAGSVAKGTEQLISLPIGNSEI